METTHYCKWNVICVVTIPNPCQILKTNKETPSQRYLIDLTRVSQPSQLRDLASHIVIWPGFGIWQRHPNFYFLGDSYAATFLLENGASVAIATPDLGNTALHLIASCSPDITPEETLTALTGVAKLMLDKGLDPNIQNKKGL